VDGGLCHLPLFSYSIWATFASPMIISADLRTLKSEHPTCLEMLLNKELVAVSQDPLGKAGKMVRQRTNSSDPTDGSAARCTNIVDQLFVRELEGGALVSASARTTSPSHITLRLLAFPSRHAPSLNVPVTPRAVHTWLRYTSVVTTSRHAPMWLVNSVRAVRLALVTHRCAVVAMYRLLA
jgi:hypothetical protein